MKTRVFLLVPLGLAPQPALAYRGCWHGPIAVATCHVSELLTGRGPYRFFFGPRPFSLEPVGFCAVHRWQKVTVCWYHWSSAARGFTTCSLHILRRFGVFCSLGLPQLPCIFFVVWSWWRWRYWSRMACYATVSEGKPRRPGKFHYTAVSEGAQVPQPCCERNRLVSSVPNCSATRVAQTARVKTRPCT